MRTLKNTTITVLAFLSLTVTAQEMTAAQKRSYALGHELVKPVIKENMDIDKEQFILGVQDTIMNQKLKMTEEEIKKEIETLVQSIVEQQEQQQAKQMKEMSAVNVKEGQEFLEKNKKEKNIVVLPSGIQYKVIESGKDLKQGHPGPTDIVVAHYEGRFIDGTVFDSSFKRNQPAEFGLDQVIMGWTETLQLMVPGDRWEVAIPAELAYGAYGAGPVIGPNKTLIFDIQLLEVKKAPKK